MPLPASDVKNVWPPKELQPIYARMRQWSAWYSGDLQKLQAAYGGGDIQDSTGFFASDHGGFKATIGRTLQRFFVGEPTRGPDRNTKLPLPIGAELCQGSADLLFADPPTVTSSVDATSERIQELMDDTFQSTLAEGGETSAAVGGTFLRVTWDLKLDPTGPFLTVVDADNAIPEFRFGRLTAVTFWWVVKVQDEKVWRHLERHETTSDGTGIIIHGLYEGSNDRLGLRLPLESIPELAALALNPEGQPQADFGIVGAITTASPGLAVFYVANQSPNRLWRDHPTGRYLGRSDLDGVEHLMDQLAEVMSAWTRAIRLAKARIFIAKSLLKNAGPGNGMVANLEQEAYTEVQSLGGKDMSLGDQIEFVQPLVNWEQYSNTAQTLLEQIVQGAGYATQTFGVGDKASIRTATEIESRERRSLLTRDRKVREWRPAIARLIEKMLLVDNAFFGGSNTVGDLDVVFSDGVQQTQLALAQTAQALFQAQSASIEERVALLHPDWDDEAIKAEAALIRDEFAPAPLMDPTFPMGGGTDGDPTASSATAAA